MLKRGFVRFKMLLWISFIGIFLGLLWIGFSLPEVTVLKDQYPSVSYIGPLQAPKIILQLTKPRGWISLHSISKLAIQAVVISEDALFFQHSGYDLTQMKDALETSLEAGRVVRGASTLTQQMVRNIFLEKDRTLLRKLKELYLAIAVEQKIGKRKILEIYMNIAEWGEGIYGIEQASKYYFEKSASNLSAKEGAFLAMLLPSPKRYSVSFRKRRLTNYARNTVNSILKKMALVHHLSAEELEYEKNKPLPFEAIFQETTLPSPQAL